MRTSPSTVHVVLRSEGMAGSQHNLADSPKAVNPRRCQGEDDMTHEETTVIIVGAGVAGLTLATFLKKSGIACVVLERRERAYVEVRQRAGVVEARGVQMFERWGLADELLGGPVAQTIEYRVNGAARVFDVASDDGSPGRFCTQQMLVN